MTEPDNQIASDENYLTRAVETAIRIGALVILIVLCFFIVRPFIAPVLWGVIIAVAAYPFFLTLQGAIGGRKRLATLLFLVLAFVLVVGPILLLTGTLVDSASEVASDLAGGSLKIPPPPESVAGWPLIGKPLAAFWSLASNNLQAALEQVGPQLRVAGTWLLSVAADAGFAVLVLAISIVISGILLLYADGGGRTAYAIGTRLAGEKGTEFVDLAKETVRSVARGVLGVALIQSILAGLGFLAVGLPGAGLLAMVVLFMAVIQIGPGLVVIPAIFYVFSTEPTLTAVLFTVWSVGVLLLDNILKPIWLGRGTRTPTVVIFIGAIGGFIAAGIVGLFLGSVILALGYELFLAWLNDKPESA